MFLAVPSFWSAEHVALLLGVASAAGLRAAGLVDAAVAAASLVMGADACLHVDLTRHRAVVTALRGGSERTRDRVSTGEGLGLRAFEDRIVREIASAFVADSRFDPLHSGASEQALRAALARLAPRAAPRRVLRGVPPGRGTRAPRQPLAGGPGRGDEGPAERGRGAGPAPRSHRRRAPAGLGARVRHPGPGRAAGVTTGLDAIELPYDATVVATLRHRDRLRHPGPALPFVTRLPPHRRRRGTLEATT